MIPVELYCTNCGKPFMCKHKKRLEYKHVFCSTKCEGDWRRKQNFNMICPVCGRPFHAKPYHIKNHSKHDLCCSRECLGIYRSIMYQGDKNPNYGNRGSKNPIWKSDKKISPYGYMLIRNPDHPFANCDGFCFEHRLVAEQNLLTPETTILIDGKPYLSPDYIVHHKDKNRLNNDPSNLEIMTLGEHTAMHAKEKRKELAS